MKRKVTILIILTTITLFIIAMHKSSYKKDDLSQMDDVSVSDFEFSLMYNVNGKDFITTFDNQLTVDTVDGVKTIDFILTKDEKQRIKEKVVELEILKEDYSKLPYSGRQDEHKGIYELVMQIDEADFKVYWTTSNYPPIGNIIILDNNITEKKSERYNGEFGKMNKLIDLKIYIHEIIIEREEYKALPPHTMYF